MKQTRFPKPLLLPLVAALSAIVLFSCNKDISVPDRSTSTPTVTDPQKVSRLVAVIEGDSFKSIQTEAMITDSGLYISGVSATGDIITLNVIQRNRLENNKVKLGSFTINSLNPHSAKLRKKDGSEYRADSTRQSGEIRVINLDTVNKMVYGTFAFRGQRADGSVKVVNGGDFKIAYDVAVVPVADPNDSIFSTNPQRIFNEMTAVIDTDTVVFDNVISFMYQGGLHLNGSNNNGEEINIQIDPKQVPGTVSLVGNFGNNSAFYLPKLPSVLKYSAQSGAFVISKHDRIIKHIEGTFYFTAKLAGSATTKQIKQGELSIDY
ncbi:MAG: DUF6252 family protein [Bacteroidota bacterium]